jgi:Ser/Thr protein kinase RdoA (MazF antagonist)
MHNKDDDIAITNDNTEVDRDDNTSTSSCEEGFRVEWTKDEIINLLRTNYNYLLNSNDGSASIECIEPKKGMENHSIIITIDETSSSTSIALRKVILRIYSDLGKTKEYIAFELDSLYKLRQVCHLPVPLIIETTKFMNNRVDIRDCIVDFKGHSAALFQFCDGQHVNKKKRASIEHIETVGEFTGHLHRVTKQYEDFDPWKNPPSANDPPFLLIDERFMLFAGRGQPERLVFEYHWEELNELFEVYNPETCTESGVDKRGQRMIKAMYDLAHKQLKHFSEQEQNELERKLPRSLVHGDAHTSNVLFTYQNEKPVISAVVDWDDCFIGPCTIDLANGLFFWCAKPRSMSTETTLLDHDIITKYLQSYQKARGFPLSDLEKSYFIDYLFLTLFSQMCFLIAHNDILDPCNVEEQEEDFHVARDMLAFFLTIGEMMGEQDFIDTIYSCSN